ncbi:hypothetical protein CERSUDRAFT_160477 [Gelatoporia subvermispora B]|uniref:Cytoplasmic tRNA 2-thiolation protein 2 n=1 Tax=Ceriporiopsis subvermispora (strain B) TaxID=914234 RepID=M2PCS5_CERS8|nr:hypothetical protein CERSUDRAFT_160477 [Gelatoporia subvermispora B]
MSSCGNPATESDALMPRRPKFDKGKNCVKCKDAPGNIVIRHAVYCKACFFPLVAFKFRRALEPFVNPKPDGPRRTALKPAGNLLLGFSGGVGSTVLLDLVNRSYIVNQKAELRRDGGKDHPRHDKVWKRVIVCYVELGDALPRRKDKTAEIAEVVSHYEDVEFVPLRVQDAFDPSWWRRIYGDQALPQLRVSLENEELAAVLTNPPSTEPLGSLRSYLSSLPTPTAVASALQSLIRVLLLHTAVETKSSHLLLGTSLTSLAISLISGIGQGAGFNIEQEIQEEWVPDIQPASDSNGSEWLGGYQKGVRIIRPLRDVGLKECAFWAWWEKLQVVGEDRAGWPESRQDIGGLTKDFIMRLEKDYPSTVSTIVRTCAKLSPRGDVSGKCVLCERPAQEGVQEWKARISVRTTAQATDAVVLSSSSTPRTDDAAAAQLAPHLCYACHTTLTSRNARPPPPLFPSVSKESSVTLPAWVGPRMRRKVGEGEMKAAIQEFLLEE